MAATAVYRVADLQSCPME